MQKRQRRSIRLPNHDYSSPGAYSITLVTSNREHLFGEIVDGKMKINDLGFLVKNEWQRLTSRFPNIELDEFVVMPNHMHGIICIVDSAIDVGARQKEDDANPMRARQKDGSMFHPFCSCLAPTRRILTPTRRFGKHRWGIQIHLGAVDQWHPAYPGQSCLAAQLL